MSNRTLSARVWQDPSYFIAFGFGSGLMPIAPGTWGTLAAMPVYLLLANSGWVFYSVATCLAFILGVFVCGRVSRDLGVHDYSGIVWDEVVGYLLTMFLAPPGFIWMCIGFVLFRVFDIWKPQPIGWVDLRVKGGWGIMLDDVLAAIPAWGILQLLAWGVQ
ncbi:MAG TPA: phosphatidylglycerophosphatase A [Legionella sp.]|nr:phosphatidylglycerophosphatase A [Legionella sp.]